VIVSIVQWAVAVLAVAGCGVMVVRLIRQEPEYERLYGRAPGWPRFHRPVRHRVPGLPRDGVLTGQEEAAIEEMERQLRGDRRP
jgi:hypothetical protein